MLKIEIGPHISEYVISKVCGGIPLGDCVGIGTSKNGVICGGVLFHQYNGVNIWMHAASEHKYWLSRKYLNFIFSYAFDTCGVKRISGFIDSPNTEAIKFFEHLGFRLESTLEKASPLGDLLIYCMFSKDRPKCL